MRDSVSRKRLRRYAPTAGTLRVPGSRSDPATTVARNALKSRLPLHVLRRGTLSSQVCLRKMRGRTDETEVCIRKVGGSIWDPFARLRFTERKQTLWEDR